MLSPKDQRVSGFKPLDLSIILSSFLHRQPQQTTKLCPSPIAISSLLPPERPVRVNMAGVGGNNTRVPVPVGILIDFGDEPEVNGKS